MEQFIVKHQDTILGTISCFDRILFKGYWPFRHPEGMESFLNSQGILFKDFKEFAAGCSEVVQEHARELARKAGRPFIYLSRGIPLRPLARSQGRRGPAPCPVRRHYPGIGLCLRYRGSVSKR